MCSVVKSGNPVHDQACYLALNTLQGAITGTPTQAQLNAAYVTFHRAVVASCKANNNSSGMGPSLDALRALGTGGN